MAVLGEPVARRLVHFEGHALVLQLRFQLDDELADDVQNGLIVKRLERDDSVQTVAELRAEELFDFLHVVTGMVLLREPHGGARHLLRAGIGGHHNDDVAEIGLAAVVVRERAVVHHLQQQVEHVLVRLFDLVEQQHRVRMFGNGFGQSPPWSKPT